MFCKTFKRLPNFFLLKKNRVGSPSKIPFETLRLTFFNFIFLLLQRISHYIDTKPTIRQYSVGMSGFIGIKCHLNLTMNLGLGIRWAVHGWTMMMWDIEVTTWSMYVCVKKGGLLILSCICLHKHVIALFSSLTIHHISGARFSYDLSPVLIVLVLLFVLLNKMT